MLVGPLNAFPWVLNGLIEAWVSMKRIEKFLSLEEMDLNAYYSNNIKGKTTSYQCLQIQLICPEIDMPNMACLEILRVTVTFF